MQGVNIPGHVELVAHAERQDILSDAGALSIIHLNRLENQLVESHSRRRA
jgi:hypothetical protein